MKPNHQYEARYVRAALRAFARGGYFGTSMEDIAQEAGVSQPRVSQVFDGKLSAYRAAHRMALTTTLDALNELPKTKAGFAPAEATAVLHTLLADQRDTAMMLFHTVAAASADPHFAAIARQTLSGLTDALVDVQGATAEQARAVLADFVLASVLVAADAASDADESVQQIADVTITGPRSGLRRVTN